MVPAFRCPEDGVGIIVLMNHVVPFASLSSVEDLQRFLTRAKNLETTGARFVVAGGVLAVSVSVMHPAGLGDGVPIVIGLRTFQLDFSGHPTVALDAVFELDAVTDRTHRMLTEASVEFPVPPVEIAVNWTALNAPRGGWRTAAVVDDVQLRDIARDGIAKVSQGLPDNPGAPLLAQIRSAVWGELLGDPAQVEFPAGVALGAHALGFLTPDGESRVSTSQGWIRVSSAGGYVLARPAVTL